MDLLTGIFNVLMHMTPHKTDTETRPERETRMHMVAEAIDRATQRAACVGEFGTQDCKPIFSDRRLLAGLLLAKGKYESGFAEYVHEGRCVEGPTGAQCDKNSDGVVQARSIWQLWRVATSPRSDWDKIEGATPEATNLAAWHAAKRLAGSSTMCKSAFGGDNVQAAIAGFAGNCMMMNPQKVALQAATARKIVATLPAG